MKNVQSLLVATALLGGISGCNSTTDSVKEAQQTNEAKADTASQSTGQGAAIKDDKNKDSEFMTKAASGGMLEVALGKEVANRALSPQAKQAAQQMVTDHTKANDELKALAAKKNITLPTSLGDDQQKVFNEVVAKKGTELDQEYVKQMVDDHQEDIKEFTDAAQHAGDPEIRAFAAKNVPILQMHLGMFTKLKSA